MPENVWLFINFIKTIRFCFFVQNRGHSGQGLFHLKFLYFYKYQFSSPLMYINILDHFFSFFLPGPTSVTQSGLIYFNQM
jgi:hypothetical protein